MKGTQTEQACKPSSVLNSHLSGPAVAGKLLRPTNRDEPPRPLADVAPRTAPKTAEPLRHSIWSCSGWGLQGLFRRRKSGELLPRLSILTLRPKGHGAVYFCCTVLGVASTGGYPAPSLCGARTFLMQKCTRLSGLLGIVYSCFVPTSMISVTAGFVTTPSRTVSRADSTPLILTIRTTSSFSPSVPSCTTRS